MITCKASDIVMTLYNAFSISVVHCDVVVDIARESAGVSPGTCTCNVDFFRIGHRNDRAIIYPADKAANII